MYVPLDVVRRIRDHCDAGSKMNVDRAFRWVPERIVVPAQTEYLLSAVLRHRLDANERYKSICFVKHTIHILGTTKSIEYIIFITACKINGTP